MTTAVFNIGHSTEFRPTQVFAKGHLGPKLVVRFGGLDFQSTATPFGLKKLGFKTPTPNHKIYSVAPGPRSPR